MEEKKGTPVVYENEAEKTCNCEAIKAELEQTKAKLEEAINLNTKYEEAYSQLVTRYNKLRTMFDAMVEHSLGAK